MALAGPFDRPIPGESLTGEPGNNPWEQPPEINDIEELSVFYIQKLAKQDVIDDFAAMCELGVTLPPIVESIYLQGVMRGIHTLDAGLNVAPVIHHFLKAAITEMGVEVKESNENPTDKAKAKEKTRFQALAAKYLSEMEDSDDPGVELLSDIMNQEPEQGMAPEQEPMMEQEEKPQGLMAKG